MRRRTDASERFAERRRQEDEAPRLRDVIPTLRTCKLEIALGRPDSVKMDVAHTRHLIVDRASSLILVACSDPSCKEGGYDISAAVLRGLRDRRTDFRGEDSCNGNVGSAHCGRVLDFRATATFAPTE